MYTLHGKFLLSISLVFLTNCSQETKETRTRSRVSAVAPQENTHSLEEQEQIKIDECTKLGSDWTPKQDEKTGETTCVRVVKLDQATCEKNGASWKWVINAGVGSCQEVNVPLATAINPKETCENKGIEWKWNETTFLCTQEIPIVLTPLQKCQAKGKPWVWVEHVTIVAGQETGECFELGKESTAQDICQKKTGWKWKVGEDYKESVCEKIAFSKTVEEFCNERTDGGDWSWVVDELTGLGKCEQNNISFSVVDLCPKDWTPFQDPQTQEWRCTQNYIATNAHNLCSELSGNWYYVEEDAQLKCKESISPITSVALCESKGDLKGEGWVYTQSGGNWICKKRYVAISAQDVCLQQGKGWTFNDKTNTCSRNIVYSKDTCERLNAQIPAPSTFNAQGDGDDLSPYLICNTAQFLDIAQSACGTNISTYCDKSYLMGVSINFATPTVLPIIGGKNGFSGTFDGDGNKIVNGKIIFSSPKAKTELNVGLFSLLTETGIIKDFNLEKITVTVDSPGEGSNVGGMVGHNHGTIENSKISDVSIVCTGCRNVGGFMGFNSPDGIVDKANSFVNIVASASSIGYGGFVGMNQGIIKNSGSSGTINANNSSYIGGFVAFDLGQFGGRSGALENIESKTNITNITDSRYIGGISANTNAATFTNVKYSNTGSFGIGLADIGTNPNYQGRISGRKQNITVTQSAPSSLTTCNPVSPVRNPTITIGGVAPEQIVSLYSESNCSTQDYGSALSTDTSVSIKTKNLEVGTYQFYAQSMDLAGNISACSTATASYTYTSQLQFLQKSYNVLVGNTIRLEAGGGTPPYTFSVGTGTTTGTLISPSSTTVDFKSGEVPLAGQTKVIAKDANGISAETQVSYLTNPTLWLDASSVNCMPSGSRIPTWKDLSNFTNDFIEAPLLGTPYFTWEPAVINKPFLRFKKNEFQSLRNTKSLNLGTTGKVTGFVVAKVKDSSNPNSNIILAKDTGDLAFGVPGNPPTLALQKSILPLATTNTETSTSTSTVTSSKLVYSSSALPSNSSSNGFHIFFYNFDNLTRTGNIFFDLGNTSNFIVPLATNTVSTGTLASTAITYLGKDPNQLQNFAGDIAEVILYPDVLNNDDMVGVLNYLKDKYTLTSMCKSPQLAGAQYFNQFGSGTTESPYLICNTTQFVDIDRYLSSCAPNCQANFLLGDDLNFNDSSISSIGRSGGFRGTFDGGGNKISRVSISYAPTLPNTDVNVGLFSVLNEGSVIRNLSLDFISISVGSPGGNNVGSLIGKNDGTIQNIKVSNVSINCDACKYIGGLAGFNGPNGSIETSQANVNLVTSAGSIGYGGFVGMNQGSISGSSASGSISGVPTSYVGGFAGFNFGHFGGKGGALENIAVTTTISVGASSYVGGIAGSMNNSTLTNVSYNGTSFPVDNGSGANGYTGKIAGLSQNLSNPTAPAQPNALTLKEPCLSPGILTTPTVTVGGVVAGHTVKIYKTNNCSGTPVGSSVASGPTVDVTSSALSAGSYGFSAKSFDTLNNISTCSTAALSYAVSGTLQFSQAGYNALAGSTVTLLAGGGTAPYTYSIVSGAGTLAGSVFSAPAGHFGRTVVKVTDATNANVQTNVSILTTPALWLDAANITCKANNTSLTAWNDVSGASKNFVQNATVPKPPLYLANSGKPVVSFVQSSGHNLENAQSLNLGSGSPVTGFVVAKITNTSDANVFLGKATGDVEFASSGTPATLSLKKSGGATPTALMSSGIVPTNVTANGFHIYAYNYSGTSGSVFYDLGNPNNDNVPFATAPVTAGTTATQALTYLGKDPNLANSLSGDIAEVILFPSILSTVNMSSVLQYLRDKHFLNSKCADLASATSYTAFGSGTEDQPYLICTAAQLNSLLTFNNTCDAACNKFFLLGQNLDYLNAQTSPLGTFKGVFNGGGNKISNIRLQYAAAPAAPEAEVNLGLFSVIDATSTVKNLKLENVTMTVVAPGGNNLGSLVGKNMGTIQNVTVTNASVTCDSCKYLGGLVGFNTPNGSIDKSQASVNFATVATSVGYGAFAGMNQGSITNSSASGNIAGAVTSYVGGFVGFNYGHFGGRLGVLNSVTATTSLSVGASSYVGGIAGTSNLAVFTNVTYTGTSLAGVIADGNQANNYTGRISGRSQSIATPAAATAPTALTLAAPCLSPGILTTPTVTVAGIGAGQTIKLYKSNNCSGSEIGSTLAVGTTVDFVVPALSPAGTYSFSSKAIDTLNNSSPCSTAPLSYTLSGTLQFGQNGYNVLPGGTVNLVAGGGTAPYTFAIVAGSGPGTLTGSTFTAPSTPTYARTLVKVTDATSANVQTNISILASPSLWLDAASVTCKAMNSDLTAWNDISGGNKHFVQNVTTPKPPKLMINTVTTKPVVSFTKLTGQNLENNSTVNLGSASAVTGFVVAKISDTSDANANVLLAKASGDIEFSASGNPSTLGLRKSGSPDVDVVVNPMVLPLNVTSNGFHIYAFNYTGTTGKIFYDLGNANNDNVPLTTASVPAGTTASAALTFLGKDPNQTNNFAGDIAEVILFPSTLDNTSMSSVLQYLRNKHNLNSKCNDITPAPTTYNASGTGGADQPYLICNKDQFVNIANYVTTCGTACDKNFLLANNIDFAGANVTPIGGATGFKGVFNGGGNKISNVALATTPTTVEANLGLFTSIGTTSIIRNLKLENVTLTVNAPGGENVAALVGKNLGLIQDSSVTGVTLAQGSCVNCKYVGGLVGFNTSTGTIERASSQVTFTTSLGSLGFGGFAGLNKGSIKNSTASGAITGIATASNFIGGFVGLDLIQDGGLAGALDTISATTTITVAADAYLVGGVMGSTNLATIPANITYTGPSLGTSPVEGISTGRFLGKLAGRKFADATNTAPAAVTSLALSTPCLSPGFLNTPTLNVNGVGADLMVKLYSSATCNTAALATAISTTADTLNMKTSTLALGTYNFYAQTIDPKLATTCAPATVSYTLNAGMQFSQKNYNVVAGTTTLTIEGGVAPYTLSVSPAGAGTFGTVTNNQVVYTAVTNNTYSVISISDSTPTTPLTAQTSVSAVSGTPALWLDAASITCKANNTTLTAWNDVSGSSKHFVQNATTPKPPTYLVSGGTTKPVVSFTKLTGHSLENNNTLNLGSTSAVTGFVVAKITDTSDANANVLLAKASGDVEFSASGNPSTLGLRKSGSPDVDLVVNPMVLPLNVTSNGFHIYSYNYNGASGKIFYDLGYTNSDNIPLSSSNAVAATTTTAALTYLGKDPNQANNFAGDIAEILLFPSTLDTTSTSAILQYLRTKHNLKNKCNDITPAPTTYNASGTGAADQPYLICNKDQFVNIATYVTTCAAACDKHFLLSNNIDFAGASVTPIGGATGFKGVFNGGGNKISNVALATTPTVEANLGLFTSIGTTSVIRNLKLENVTLTVNAPGGENVAALVGKNLGLIQDSSVTGVTLAQGNCINCKFVGGLVGFNTNTGTIERSSSQVTFTTSLGSLGFGGFAGLNKGSIKNSSAAGAITGIATASNFIGGFVGLDLIQDGGLAGALDAITSTTTITVAADAYLVGGVIGSTNLATIPANVTYTGPSLGASPAEGISSGRFLGKLAGRKFADATANPPAAVTGLSLTNPCMSPGYVNSPTLAIDGVAADLMLNLYSSATCTGNSLASTISTTAGTLNMTTPVLTPANYNFYVKTMDAKLATTCAPATVAYTVVNGMQFSQKNYNSTSGAVTLKVEGGNAPYSFSVAPAGTGTFSGQINNTVVFTPASSNSLSTITVNDATPTTPLTAQTTVSTLASPALWLDASSITCKADGSSVATWTDKSGAGKDFTQATAANQPIFKTNVVSTQPVIRFNKTNGQFLSNAAGLEIGGTGAATGFVVAKVTDSSNPTANALLSKSTGDIGLLLTGTSPRMTLAKMGAVGAAPTKLVYDRLALPGETTTGGYHIYYYSVNGAAGGAAKIYVDLGSVTNGASDPLTNKTISAITLTNAPTSVTYLGRDPTQNNVLSTFSGDIAEVIVFPSVLADTDLNNVASMLKDKYGLNPKKWNYANQLVDGRATTAATPITFPTGVSEFTVSLFGGGGGGARGCLPTPGGAGGGFGQASFPFDVTQSYSVTVGGARAGNGGITFSGYAQTIATGGLSSYFKVNGVDKLIAYGGPVKYSNGPNSYNTILLARTVNWDGAWIDPIAINPLIRIGSADTGAYAGNGSIGYGGGGAGGETGNGYNPGIPNGGPASDGTPGGAGAVNGTDRILSYYSIEGGSGGGAVASGRSGGWPGGGGSSGAGSCGATVGGTGAAGAAFIEYRAWQ